MRRMAQYIYTLAAMIVATGMILIQGCKPAHEFHRPASILLPQFYTNTGDSTIESAITWSEFFHDPYLKDLIDTALENNWDTQLALQRIQLANADYAATRAALVPSVAGVVTVGGDRYSKTAFNPPSTNTSLGSNIYAGLQSSWEIDIWNKLKNRRKSAFLRYLSSAEGLRLIRTNLIAAIGERYFSLLALDSTVAITRRNTRLQKEALDIIIIQKEGGRATELAVQQSKAQLLNTQNLEKEYKQQIVETENEINSLLGRLTGTINRKTDMSDGLLRTFAAGVPSNLLLRRPDIRQAELELQAFETDIKVARAAFMPAVTLIPYAGLNTANPLKILDPSSLIFGVAGGLTAPLFNRIAIKSNYERSFAAARESFYSYQKIINTSYIEVINNMSRIKNLKERYELKSQQTKTLKDAVNVSRDLYIAGYASYLEVIIAQGSALQAELELVSVKNNINQSQIDLYRALGGGWS